MAQTPIGNGLRGDYYDGIAFAHLTGSRTDGLIKFSWHGTAPMSGVASERFTVRWTGWLVPPVTGRYVLHLDVDDGAELWLDERELLGAWRGQSLNSYQVAVQLEAGHAYPLRLDYLQYGQLAHINLRWELPPAPAERHSWYTLWGLAEAPLLSGENRVETIPTRYLFTSWPAPASTPTARAAARLAASGRVVPTGRERTSPRWAKLGEGPTSWPAAARAQVARITARTAASGRAVPLPPMRVRLGEVRVGPAGRRGSERPAAPRTDTLATHLAKGQALTLRTLYFAQSQADLLPPVLASLDTLARALAQALRQHPSLRVEVQGHTDNQGDSALNRQLSQRRAEAVCRYLAAHGVPASCLRPVGLGGTQPVADNNLPAERPRNRRVVLRPVR